MGDLPKLCSSPYLLCYNIFMNTAVTEIQNINEILTTLSEPSLSDDCMGLVSIREVKDAFKKT